MSGDVSQLDTLLMDKTLHAGCHDAPLTASDRPQAACVALISQLARKQLKEAYDNAQLELAEDLAYACSSIV